MRAPTCHHTHAHRAATCMSLVVTMICMTHIIYPTHHTDNRCSLSRCTRWWCILYDGCVAVHTWHVACSCDHSCTRATWCRHIICIALPTCWLTHANCTHITLLSATFYSLHDDVYHLSHTYVDTITTVRVRVHGRSCARSHTRTYTHTHALWHTQILSHDMSSGVFYFLSRCVWVCGDTHVRHPYGSPRGSPMWRAGVSRTPCNWWHEWYA